MFLAGDFNVAKEGFDDVDHHYPLTEPVHRANYGTQAKAINDLFSFMTGFVLDEPTRYTFSTGRLAFIDRASYVAASWVSSQFNTKASFSLGLPLCLP